MLKKQSGRRQELSPPPAATRPLLAGAPLDFIKVVAAAFMVIDHANVVFLNHDLNALWQAGRIAFPLFCFALAYNFRSGATLVKYAGTLLLLGLVSQPISAYVLGESAANVLFTLAAGAILLTVLRRQKLPIQHLVFFCAAASTLLYTDPTRPFIDFGLPGLLLPAALFLVMQGRRSHLIWLVCLLFGLNWHTPDPWQFAPVAAFVIAVAGSGLALASSVALAGRPRFLPRYALHLFYPGHLLLLMLLHAVV
jgi:hypothetical protein